MSINRNSLFFTITLFFIILIVTAHLIIYVGYNITKQQQIDLLVTKYMKTLHRAQDEVTGFDKKEFMKKMPKDREKFLPLHHHLLLIKISLTWFFKSMISVSQIWIYTSWKKKLIL